MGCCPSKQSNSVSQQEPVANAIREKHILLVDLPPSQPNKSSVSSSGSSSVTPTRKSVDKNSNSEHETRNHIPTAPNTTENRTESPTESVVVQTSVEPSKDTNDQIVQEHRAIVNAPESVVNASQSVEIIHHEPPVETSIATVSVSTEVEQSIVSSEPTAPPGESSESAPVEEAPMVEEPAVKYSEVDRIASFSLGHNGHAASTTTRESEHDHDRLKHFQKLGSATLVQGRHGPVMTGRGGKNRRSSTQHFPTEAPIVVSPRSAEI